MIAIVAGLKDVHAARVLQELAAIGRDARVIDFRAFGQGGLLHHPLGGPPVVSVPGGRDLVMDEVTAVWNRRPNPPVLGPGIMDDDARRFCRREWAEALDGVLLSMDALFVNPIVAERVAAKSRQLAVAREVGLRIPDTIVTNDAALVAEFVEKHGRRVIHKALTAPGERLLETRVWQESDRDALADLVHAPTVFQELIDGPADYRVTVVGERLLAARIETRAGRGGVDSRLDMDAGCQASELPDHAAARISKLMRTLGLHYGTIDLKLTDEGEFVFFEVNTQGQFLYIEILTGLPIARAMADLLAGAR